MINIHTAPYPALVLRIGLGAMFLAHSVRLRLFVFTLRCASGEAARRFTFGRPAHEYPDHPRLTRRAAGATADGHRRHQGAAPLGRRRRRADLPSRNRASRRADAAAVARISGSIQRKAYLSNAGASTGNNFIGPPARSLTAHRR